MTMHATKRRNNCLTCLATTIAIWGSLTSSLLINRINASTLTSLDSDDWLLAIDPDGKGRDEKWFVGPPASVQTKKTRVPWIIQDAFPAYHGVAWYWRDFNVPQHPDPNGRVLLRFWGVDYFAEVWLNGERVGAHEGGETPFVLDVTDVVKTDGDNRLAVRVLNPTHQPIDCIMLNQTPKQARVIPYHAGAAYNVGGITDSVEVLLAPAVRVEDMFVRPDSKTDTMRVVANIRNAGDQPAAGRIEFSVAGAAGGETISALAATEELPPGDTRVEVELKIAQPRLWDLSDPYLYRVTARVTIDDLPESADERSVRCGFRDFRFENGYFRLNARRLFLRSTHTCNHFPVGLRLPHDPDLARRDLIHLKAMGFNMVRFIWGGALRSQLDLCDELGLMVYEESFAAWPMEPSPQMNERWDRSISELIRRDRNHPSIVAWGLLNETSDGPQFRRAAASLPMVRALDDSRMVFLNSGRWDLQGTPQSLPVGLDVWRTTRGSEPWVSHNPGKAPVRSHFVFDWSPGQVALHPGPGGEYSVTRFASPAAGRYAVDAMFTGLPRFGFNMSKATTDVHVLHNGEPLFQTRLNIDGTPNGAAHRSEIELAEGGVVDFVVGFGNGNHGNDSTALAATLRLSGGKIFDVSADFSSAKNPGGRWTYGTFAPGEKPDAATFVPYAENVVAKASEFGTLSNPGSNAWQDVLADHHSYPRVPHTAETIAALRSENGGEHPLFLSEYGIGSAVDLWRVTRHFERLGKPESEDARFYRDRLDRYLADYRQWKLDEIYPRPENYFSESVRRMADARTLGLNAIRSNPNIVGYNVTGANDHVSTGEGLTTTFRELKPGTMDAMFEGWAPLRWCLFAEPANVYRGATIHLDAVLANEDALPPGDYPVRVQVVGPDRRIVLNRRLTLTIPPVRNGKEPPLAQPVFSEGLKIDGPSGRYQLLTTLEQGGAPTGGQTYFHVADPVDMPSVTSEVVLWGDDPELAQWLGEHRIRSRAFDETRQSTAREVILASGRAPKNAAGKSFAELARRIARGATVVFLSPTLLARGDQSLGWAPLPGPDKGRVVNIHSWLYLKDDWAKDHPIFAGLPADGLMDPHFYREIIPDAVFTGGPLPSEAVAGSIKASQDYSSGLTLAVHELGAGRFIFNTLLIRENLGRHPAAERLLRNLLNYAAHDIAEPAADLPSDFDEKLKSMGLAPVEDN